MYTINTDCFWVESCEEWLPLSQRQWRFIPLLPEILEQLLPSHRVLESNVEVSITLEILKAIDVLISNLQLRTILMQRSLVKGFSSLRSFIVALTILSKPWPPEVLMATARKIELGLVIFKDGRKELLDWLPNPCFTSICQDLIRQKHAHEEPL